MASERDDSPGRFATYALALAYLFLLCSFWLPVSRKLIDDLTRSRYRREATVFIVLVLAALLVLDLVIPT